jgi:hypothetical protein
VKAEPALQRRLVDLAEVDAELNRLAHRRRTLPEHTELSDAEAALRSGRDKLVEVETAAGDLDRDIRRIERDVEGVRARTERDNAMLAGAGIGAKQANDLQHELEHLARRQSVLEDEQLEVMEQREASHRMTHVRSEVTRGRAPAGRDRARGATRPVRTSTPAESGRLRDATGFAETCGDLLAATRSDRSSAASARRSWWRGAAGLPPGADRTASPICAVHRGRGPSTARSAGLLVRRRVRL